MLRDRILREQTRLADERDQTDQSWLSSVMALGTVNGSLDQFKRILEQLEKLTASPEEKGKRLKTIGKSMAWPFQRAGTERYMRVIERQKGMVYLALQNDNL